MKPVPLHRNALFCAKCESALSSLIDMAPGLKFAVVASTDGFEIASYGAKSGDNGRLSSMASSMQGLSDAVSVELALGQSDYLTIAAPQGQLVLKKCQDIPVIVAAAFDLSETLGKAIFSVVEVAKEIEQITLSANEISSVTRIRSSKVRPHDVVTV